jgi:peptidoglycan/LPS O-acetylase OafA/YrhL
VRDVLFSIHGFRYLVCFFVGALLNDRPAAPRFYGFYSLMSVAGISVFVALRLLPDLIPSPYLTILAVTAGAAALLAGVLGAPATFAFLDRWPLRVLGRVSYSLYLLHPAVLGLCAVAAFQADIEISPVLANLFLFFISVAITVLLSVVTHRFVELHGIALGRKITRWAAARSADRIRIEQLQPRI